VHGHTAVIVTVSPIVFTSETPVTCTVCGLFQLDGVNVIVGGKSIRADVSLDVRVIVLSAPGSPVKVTVIKATPPSVTEAAPPKTTLVSFSMVVKLRLAPVVAGADAEIVTASED
jgi:hypothetical protein